MDAEILYKIVNASVLPAWALLMFFPTSKVTKVVVHSYLYPVVLGLLYAVLILPSFFQGGEGGMDSVASLQVGFENGWVLVGAWIHYLIFDLFIGAWELRDSQKNKISHWVMMPVLLVTLFVGPVGLMLYLAVRYYKKRTIYLA